MFHGFRSPAARPAAAPVVPMAPAPRASVPAAPPTPRVPLAVQRNLLAAAGPGADPRTRENLPFPAFVKSADPQLPQYMPARSTSSHLSNLAQSLATGSPAGAPAPALPQPPQPVPSAPLPQAPRAPLAATLPQPPQPVPSAPLPQAPLAATLPQPPQPMPSAPLPQAPRLPLASAVPGSPARPMPHPKGGEPSQERLTSAPPRFGTAARPLSPGRRPASPAHLASLPLLAGPRPGERQRAVVTAMRAAMARAMRSRLAPKAPNSLHRAQPPAQTRPSLAPRTPAPTRPHDPVQRPPDTRTQTPARVQSAAKEQPAVKNTPAAKAELPASPAKTPPPTTQHPVPAAREAAPVRVQTAPPRTTTQASDKAEIRTETRLLTPAPKAEVAKKGQPVEVRPAARSLSATASAAPSGSRLPVKAPELPSTVARNEAVAQNPALQPARPAPKAEVAARSSSERTDESPRREVSSKAPRVEKDSSWSAATLENGRAQLASAPQRSRLEPRPGLAESYGGGAQSGGSGGGHGGQRRGRDQEDSVTPVAESEMEWLALDADVPLAFSVELRDVLPRQGTVPTQRPEESARWGPRPPQEGQELQTLDVSRQEEVAEEPDSAEPSRCCCPQCGNWLGSVEQAQLCSDCRAERRKNLAPLLQGRFALWLFTTRCATAVASRGTFRLADIRRPASVEWVTVCG